MSTLASIKTKVPNLATFTVRGTVPLPKGYSYIYSADCPFTVVDPSGNDPLSFLMAEGNDQLDSRAHLLAVLQNL